MMSGPSRSNFNQFSFPLVSRWLLSRSGHALLAVGMVGVIIVLVNLMFSDFFLSRPRDSIQPRIIMPYPPHYRQLVHSYPEESHLQRRTALLSKFFKKSRHKKRSTSLMCIHPKLDLKHDVNKFAYHEMRPLNCTGRNLFYVHNNSFLVNRTVADQSKLGFCSLYTIKRLNDNSFSYKNIINKEKAPFETPVRDDFVRIRCILQSTIEEERKVDEEETKETALHMHDEEDRDVSDEAEYEHEDKVVKLENRNTQSNRSDSERKHKKVVFGSEENELEDYDDQPLNDPSYYNLLDGGIFDHKDISLSENKFEYEADFDQFIVQVHPKTDVFERISKLNAEPDEQNMKLNVLMIGLDSISHLCFQRKLPLTYRLLKDELDAAVLENYNIVGDATTAALIPILTGKTEMELPEARTSVFESGTVDAYPFIWNHFRDQGYVTLFAEDEPSISTFNLRLNGFENQPTDHYMRHFWLALWDSSLRSNSQKYCTGPTPHHHFLLQYLEDFFVEYHNVSKFAFGFHVEFTHSDNNPAQYIDADLARFIRRLKNNNILDDTVLIIMADHGARYSKVRSTVQGKLEERLPMMSFVFPKKFQKRFPALWKNLMDNRQRLSTPFDVHETLLDILNFSRARTSHPAFSRGISLLQQIPVNRTCRSAAILAHWCSCMQQIALGTDEEFVRDAALTLTKHINTLTAPHRHQCAELHLTQIDSAFLLIPNEQVLKFRHSKDSDHRLANFSGTVDPDFVHQQLQIKTQPCGALFEATIAVSFRTSEIVYSVTPGISRINKYGDQPACLRTSLPNLREFCCCNIFLKSYQANEKNHQSPMSHVKSEHSPLAMKSRSPQRNKH